MIRTRLLRGFAAPVLLAALAAPPLHAAGAERKVERKLGPEVRSIEIENLAGSVVVRRGDAGRILATVRAEDSAGKPAREWTETLELDVDQSGGRVVMRAIYPLDRYRRFHYPVLRDDVQIEPAWLAAWIDVGGSGVEYQGRRVRVSGRAGTGTPTLWVDFAVELPEGVAVTVKNRVGEIRSSGVAGAQRLDSSSGDIEVADGRGPLEADTGSGDVTITAHQGDVAADTGSGDVTLTGVRAESIDADTGSGDVRLEACTGSLAANTGSGDIVGRGLVLGARLRADTGSGDVKLSGDFAAVRDLVIDTGSGDVALVVSAVPSVQLRVSTGSGDIDVDVDTMRVRRSRDEFVADLGAAEGDATIDTGSGDVTVRQHGGRAPAREGG
jgi:hypothetical protein